MGRIWSDPLTHGHDRKVCMNPAYLNLAACFILEDYTLLLVGSYSISHTFILPITTPRSPPPPYSNKHYSNNTSTFSHMISMCLYECEHLCIVQHTETETETENALCRFDDVCICRCGGEELHDGLLPVGQASIIMLSCRTLLIVPDEASRICCCIILSCELQGMVIISNIPNPQMLLFLQPLIYSYVTSLMLLLLLLSHPFFNVLAATISFFVLGCLTGATSNDTCSTYKKHHSLNLGKWTDIWWWLAHKIAKQKPLDTYFMGWKEMATYVGGALLLSNCAGTILSPNLKLWR